MYTHGANDYGVDGSFRSVTIDVNATGERRRETGFAIDFQAKASVSWVVNDGEIIYALEQKAYNDLVRRSVAASTFVVVLLCLPRDEVEWHESIGDRTVMRNACYWLSLRGEPSPNTSKVTVRFPMDNLLTASSLRELLAADQAAREALFDE